MYSSKEKKSLKNRLCCGTAPVSAGAFILGNTQGLHGGWSFPRPHRKWPPVGNLSTTNRAQGVSGDRCFPLTGPPLQTHRTFFFNYAVTKSMPPKYCICLLNTPMTNHQNFFLPEKGRLVRERNRSFLMSGSCWD